MSKQLRLTCPACHYERAVAPDSHGVVRFTSHSFLGATCEGSGQRVYCRNCGEVRIDPWASAEECGCCRREADNRLEAEWRRLRKKG